MPREFGFKMGSKVRDRVTRFEGIITTRQDHISGCNTYWVTPLIDKDGKHVDQHSFDEPRLELLEPPKEELVAISERARQVAGPGPG